MPIDKNDVGIGWTVQPGASLPAEEEVPGQVFHVSQLPDPKRQAEELGPNYPELYANVGGRLPVYESKEEAAAQPGGPEPSDLDRQGVFSKPVERFEEALEKQPEQSEVNTAQDSGATGTSDASSSKDKASAKASQKATHNEK